MIAQTIIILDFDFSDLTKFNCGYRTFLNNISRERYTGNINIDRIKAFQLDGHIKAKGYENEKIK